MRKTILFADDEPWFSSSTVEMLMDSGYDVVPVEDGTAVIEYIESGKPVDLLILDIMMPTGNKLIDPAFGRRTGIKVGEYIRYKLKFVIPIIYLTVIEEQSVYNHILKVESSIGNKPLILVKPINQSELDEVIFSCIGSSE